MATETKIEPALTPDEWSDCAVDGDGANPRDGFDWQPGESWRAWSNSSQSILYVTDEAATRETVSRIKGSRERHALAALCLYEQPFGFTQEDVALLRNLAGLIKWGGMTSAPEHVTGLAERIAALLPPTA